MIIKGVTIMVETVSKTLDKCDILKLNKRKYLQTLNSFRREKISTTGNLIWLQRGK